MPGRARAVQLDDLWLKSDMTISAISGSQEAVIIDEGQLSDKQHYNEVVLIIRILKFFKEEIKCCDWHHELHCNIFQNNGNMIFNSP